MLELKLTVSDPAQIAQIMAIVTGSGAAMPTTSAAAAATPEVVKEKKTKEKVTEMPIASAASAPVEAAAPAQASSESPADIRKRLTPKIVAIAQDEAGRAKIKAIWAELGVGKFSEVPDSKLADVEAKLA